ncbi:hypothetical protein [Paraburkholderia sp. J8-2]|uniref:hypothetical protein n=1 Tax=Paraburkholderia sp. J8-2 TaxID=2805440 RepID=UPI002AB7E07D|nr:hypothetical protein [Paraburkholderia sp. J8-2]
MKSIFKSNAFLAFAILFESGFILLLWSAIQESKLALHSSYVVMGVVAPVAAVGVALFPILFRRPAKQLAA